MLFEKIVSEGLAHNSYIIGDRDEAVVIDPRRDCDIYIEKAIQNGLRISHILETHRNEDYLIGSLELASGTGARPWHADESLGYKYGSPVEDGQTWKIGRFRLRAIHTPGHTPGSMSYLLHDPDGAPWMLFGGDTLFAGDVGRVDLLGPERMEEMAGLLYDTIFNKILPLGDEVILCPAHGSGSVCGSSISDRPLTTIGLERKHNAKLQASGKDAFVAEAAKQQEFPPYFLKMEKWNVEGPPPLRTLPAPPALTPELFSEKARGAVVLDIRMELGFGAAHVPGSLSIWQEGLPSFAGWFLPYDTPILLVNHPGEPPTQAVRYLARLGYDSMEGYLAGGIHAWHMEGKESSSIRTVTAQDLCRSLDTRSAGLWVLDVRGADELEANGKIAGAHNIHITQLPKHLDEIPKDKTICIFCGSGLRSMIAASILKREGRQDLMVVSGGFAGWNSVSCPRNL